MRARAATADDYDHFARLVAELMISEPPPPREWWERFHGNGLFLEESGVPIAYAHGYTLGRELAYVLHVAVDRGMRNRGVGGTLMNALASKLRESGCTEWCLNVVASNAPAIALYRKLGMDVAYTTELLELPWASLEQLPHESVVVDELRSEDDADVEKDFNLPQGRLATSRQMPGRVLKRTDGGLIVFDPAFPGAPHFRARTPGIARALLEAVRAHRGPEHERLRLHVENDPALLSALRGAGAELVTSLLHLRGPMP